MARQYANARREQQAADTKTTIVVALTELLIEQEPATISVGDVARRAGVSERTVYRHFANREELFDGLQDYVADQVHHEGSTRRFHNVDELVAMVPRAFGAIEAVGDAYQAAQLTAAGRRAHDKNNRGERRDEISSAFTTITEDLDPASADRLRAVVHALASSSSFFLMKDVWHLSTDDASEAVAWAIETLAKAAADVARDGGTIGHDFTQAPSTKAEP